MDGSQSLSPTPEGQSRAEIEAWLEARSAMLSALIQSEILRIVTEAFEAFIRTVDETAVTAAGDPAAVDSIIPKWNVVAQTSIAPAVQETYLAGSVFAYAVADGKRSIPPSTARGWAKVVNQQAVEYAAQATNRLRGVGDTLWKDISKKVTTAIETGASGEMLKQEIESLAQFSEFRADTIGRTETSIAYSNGNFAADQALGEFGPLEKIWVAVGDARTRAAHLEAMSASTASPVPFSEPFSVGGVPMMFPHAPGAPAGEVVNCRCFYEALYAGDTRPDGSIVSASSEPLAAPAPDPVEAEAGEFLTDGDFGAEFSSGQWIEITDDNQDRFLEAWTAGRDDISRDLMSRMMRQQLQQSRRSVINGDVVLMDRVGVSDDDFRFAVSELDALRSANKQAGNRLLVRITDLEDGVWGECEVAARDTANQIMNISASALQSTDLLPTTGFFQASYPMMPRHWTIPHEYGHAMDQGALPDAPRNTIFGKWAKQPEGLSGYGRTNKWEAYAESFADWFTSRGTTTNPATLAYAEQYGWRLP